jgi:hypothetical protein
MLSIVMKSVIVMNVVAPIHPANGFFRKILSGNGSAAFFRPTNPEI